MAHRDPTQIARLPLLLMAYATAQGLDREALLLASGLTESALADPDSRIPTRSMVRLWQAIIEEFNDPLLGLNVARSVSVNQLGLVGYSMRHSATLRDALQRLARYQRVLSEAVRAEIIEQRDEFTVSWILHPALKSLRVPVELGVTLVLRIARELTGVAIRPVRLELPTPQPDALSEYRAEFACPILFETQSASLVFTASQMSLPVITADGTLVGYLDELAEITAEPLDAKHDSTTTAVRRTLWGLLPTGKPSIWHTARTMGISVRTLQRRLGEEGGSYSSVLDGLRRDVAGELLGKGTQSAADVAFLLGYSEPSAFHRAVRRWQNIPPAGGMN